MDTSRTPRVLVDVDGRAVCARLRRPLPSNAPATPVVLVAGGAGQGTEGEWGPVVEDRLVEERPVLTYDRSGAGAPTDRCTAPSRGWPRSWTGSCGGSV